MSPVATFTVDDARAAVLDAADELFFSYGVSAVGMARVRDRSGVSMRRLYSMFPRKSDLVTSWLEHRHEAWMNLFIDGIERRLSVGQEPADAIFETLTEWLTATDFRGCGFINTLAETGEVTDEHRAVIRNHKQSLINVLSDLSEQPTALAVLIDGAIVQASVFTSSDPVNAARLASASLFDTSLRGTTPHALPGDEARD